jgi:anti-anti-sigma regulatory factor
MCSGFNAILDETFTNMRLTSYIIDLRDANYLDSTSLGLIAKIARHTHLNSLPRPSIFSTNENINEILNSMGFDGIFLILKPEFDSYRHILSKK